MTGKAESQRKVHARSRQAGIENGGFEQTMGDPPEAAVWHYQRQMKIVTDKEAPEGGHYAIFSNAEPGRGSQALQGFAVDGRKVKALTCPSTSAGKISATVQRPTILRNW